MSLLIPTEEDYEDAHGHIQDDLKFKEICIERKDDRDEHGKLKNPWSFEVVHGFFAQSDPNLDDSHFNYITEDMGRLKSWDDIKSELKNLNSSAPDNTCYKLLFLARHGQGYHNRIVMKYGPKEWNAKWKYLGNDGEYEYGPDAQLTETGILQAQENHEFWKAQIEKGAPIPDVFYVSPMQRSSYTLLHTWKGLRPADKAPIVVEAIRETMDKCLCNKRSTKSVINERFDQFGYIIDEPFSEEDELFESKTETPVDHALRMNDFYQFLFNKDWNSEANLIDKKCRLEKMFISTTSHAGSICYSLMALNHRRFTITTGGMIPIVVRATRRLD